MTKSSMQSDHPRPSRAERIAAVQFEPRGLDRLPVRECNLCGASTFVVVTHEDRYGYAIEAHGCLQCGLVFLNPVLSGPAYQRFYETTYRPLVSAYHGRLIDASSVQADQRIYAGERADFVEPFLAGRTGGRLLDVGGSTGVVALEFVRRFEMTGLVLDPSPQELEQAAGHGLETVAGLVEEYEPGSDRFDLILLCQTIDHLLDIRGTLRKIRSLLRAGGLFYVDIVDFRAGYLRNGSVEAAVKVDHPFYLTEWTAEAFLARAGFEVVRKDYAADHLHVGYLCRPAKPVAGALPDPAVVAGQWREIRLVQNRMRGG
ncbi:MAG: class I SAM-dependent methyltransferase [Gemmatimonadales bacterium]